MSTIREVLDRKGGAVLTTSRGVSVLEAIGVMSQANIGAMVIVDEGRPIGIFTERDYLRKIALEGRSSRETRIEEVMSAPLITVSPAEPSQHAMETMTECRCRHLVVVEGDEMVGIVSLGDLVKHMLVVKEAEVEQLSSYIFAGQFADERIENYTVDPQTLLMQFDFEDDGDEMMGIYHSHPVSVAYPSATDAWNAPLPRQHLLHLFSGERPEACHPRLSHDAPFSGIWI